ncbi:MAG: DNA polymerase III, subunit gamma and tau [Actinobacteria bacterium 21-64-8]|nr:MAG: DNA polymerase III, subunit gamma and tau [Actinobacteria bacterium 21-64-8]
MSEPPSSLIPVEGVTSLYRRFRPGRFSELRGQDHVVRALQGAVKGDRISHAYLFSGPRGTGKTTTARLLAKALNCENPAEGDACGVCASCVAIAKGSSLDVIELDAASNNGVDDIREIIAGAWHNTPGRWKIYIFDEVHQLSKAASAALLKTLEEPPGHVIFVLATTDPHKVLPTIRSRTQHLEFRLFTGETLSSLLHEVEHAAKLNVDDATIEAAVRMGRGSARDALSALDQLLATGSLDETQPSFDPLLAALVANDAVEALRALGHLSHEGWDPEQLSESFVAEVRQIFLLLVAPDVADAVDADRARLLAWGQQLGLARSVRVIETMGKAIRDMKSASEKLVTLEVALVRLVRPELDVTYEALEERLTKLERASRVSPPSAPPVSAPPSRPIGASTTPSTPSTQPAAPNPPASPSPSAPRSRSDASEPLPAEPDATPASEGPLTLEDVRERFVHRVIPRTSRAAQLLLRSARVEAVAGTRVTIAVGSEETRQNTEMIAQGLRSALEHEFKVALQLAWIVDPSLALSTSAPVTARPSPRAPSVDDDFVVDEDNAGVVVDSAAEHLLTEMFPGTEEIS